MRQDGGDAGADVVSANDGGVTDRDTGDVGDGVELTARQNADLQTEFGRAGASIGGGGLGEQAGRGKEKYGYSCKLA